MRSKPEIPAVVFEVTSACNLHCRYCYNVWHRPAEAANPTPASYELAAKTLKRLFRVADVQRVTMSGGEPLLVRRLPELVLLCRLRHKTVSIVTNGNAGEERDYRDLLEVGAGIFQLPQHSPDPEPHDVMTGMAGSWAAARRSIEQLRALDARVGVVVVLTQLNHLVVRETLRHIADLGVREVMLNRFNVGGRGLEAWRSLALSPEQLRTAFATADEAAADGALKITSNVCTPFCLVDPADFPHVRFATCSADVTRRPLTLTVAGDLRFCNHSPVVLGNIHHDDLQTMLASEYVAHWRSVVPAPCQGCQRFDACFGGCRAASEQLGLTVADPDPTVGPVRPDRSPS